MGPFWETHFFKDLAKSPLTSYRLIGYDFDDDAWLTARPAF